MKGTKRQFTRSEVIEGGRYLGFYERPNGSTEQRWEMGGVIFSEVCDATGHRSAWNCLGKASRVAKYGL